MNDEIRTYKKAYSYVRSTIHRWETPTKGGQPHKIKESTLRKFVTNLLLVQEQNPESVFVERAQKYVMQDERYNILSGHFSKQDIIDVLTYADKNDYRERNLMQIVSMGYEPDSVSAYEAIYNIIQRGRAIYE